MSGPMINRSTLRVLTRHFWLSADKGIEEKDYEFSIDLYEEVVPEVRMHSICSEDCF